MAAKKSVPEKNYWLLKSEPSTFSIEDLEKSPKKTTGWDGVRNYQARNFLRDSMKAGDGVLFYHSNADPPAIVGIAEIVREGYPDDTALDKKHHHFDPKSKADAPTWFMVDIRHVKTFKKPLPLEALRGVAKLKHMTLLQKGSRLSVQPVSAEEWQTILDLAQE